MIEPPERSLLKQSDGPAVRVDNPDGDSPVVLVCDHASRQIPAALGNLGLANDILESHVAWDPGASALAAEISQRLNAPLISSGFSRLVCDVNRQPGTPESIRQTSEVHEIPGNLNVSVVDQNNRVAAIYDPFHAAIEATLERRPYQSILVTIHTFTPVYFDQNRAVELGLVFDDDPRLADAMASIADQFTSMETRQNEPYGPDDGVTHTLRRHAVPRGILNVMIEIRNDLVAKHQDQVRVAGELGNLILEAIEQLDHAATAVELQG